MPMFDPPHPGRLVRQECLEPLCLTVTAGAKALAPAVDQPSGDRMAFVEDPLGNQWYITRPARP